MTLPTFNLDRPGLHQGTADGQSVELFQALDHMLEWKDVAVTGTNAAATDTWQLVSSDGAVNITKAYTGSNAATTDLDVTVSTEFALTTDAAGGANDFDLMAPKFVGQTVSILLALKDTQNATITEDTSVNILQNNGTGVASVTLDATDEFLVVKAIKADTWVTLATNGTIA